MNDHSTPLTSQRLQRLTAWLAHDPDNPELLVEACDEALACGQNEQAERLLARAERAAPPSPALQLRRAHLCMRREAWGQARTLLEDLRRSHGDHPALLHDLACVHLLAGDAQAAHDLLAPASAAFFADAGSAQGLLQAQWLRACHHLGRVEEAWTWTERAHSTQVLQAEAAGVASLIALDQDEELAARTWADMALAANPRQHEALVARGCLSVAAGELGQGTADLQLALQTHPDDARTCSSLGVASLLARDFPEACRQLERAVAALPSHAPSWQALGWARLLRGEQEAALAALRRCVDEDETSAEANAALALALAVTGHGTDAEQSLRRAEAIDPQDEVAATTRAFLAGAAPSADLQPALQRLLAQWRPRP